MADNPRDRRLSRDLMDGDRLLTAAEVAVLLRVHHATVTRWDLAGKFPDAPNGAPGVIHTPGGDLRVRESVVRGLLDGTLSPRETRRG